MAFEIIWTQQAKRGYDTILDYLSSEWTKKEVKNFVQHTFKFLDNLSEYPRLLESSKSQRNVHKGPINKYTILTYRVKPRKKEIELLSIRSSRQKPIRD